MIRNWNDGNNNIFKCKPRLKEGKSFKVFRRETWIRNLPRFNEDKPHYAEDNLSPNILVDSHLSLMIKILLKMFTVRFTRHKHE